MTDGAIQRFCCAAERGMAWIAVQQRADGYLLNKRELDLRDVAAVNLVCPITCQPLPGGRVWIDNYWVRHLTDHTGSIIIPSQSSHARSPGPRSVSGWPCAYLALA